jgi:RNA polymerase sigma-70 factor (ECF subfamily)
MTHSTLDDSVGLALLVVLQRLTPAERVVFVLHDIFRLSFDEVAETVGRSTAACRQLARRARQKTGEGSTAARVDVDAAEHEFSTRAGTAVVAGPGHDAAGN